MQRGRAGGLLWKLWDELLAEQTARACCEWGARRLQAAGERVPDALIPHRVASGGVGKGNVGFWCVLAALPSVGGGAVMLAYKQELIHNIYL